jgi:hypothetical protein
MTSERDDTAVEGIRGWDVARDFVDLVGRAFALAIALGLLLTGAAVVLPAPLHEPVSEESLRPEEATSGCFLMRREGTDPWVAAPTLSTPGWPGTPATPGSRS